MISSLLHVKIGQLLLREVVVLVAEPLGLHRSDAEEVHQVLDLLFEDELLVEVGHGLHLSSNFVGVLVAHFQLLEHLVHVPLRVLVAIVDGLLGELDVPLHLLLRNRRNIVICRNWLEDLAPVLLDDSLLLDHLAGHLHLHQAVGVIKSSLALLAQVEALTEDTLVSYSDDPVLVPAFAADDSMIHQSWLRLTFEVEYEGLSFFLQHLLSLHH